jgi:hypothetical protein
MKTLDNLQPRNRFQTRPRRDIQAAWNDAVGE